MEKILLKQKVTLLGLLILTSENCFASNETLEDSFHDEETNESPEEKIEAEIKGNKIKKYKLKELLECQQELYIQGKLSFWKTLCCIDPSQEEKKKLLEEKEKTSFIDKNDENYKEDEKNQEENNENQGENEEEKKDNEGENSFQEDNNERENSFQEDNNYLN